MDVYGSMNILGVYGCLWVFIGVYGYPYVFIGFWVPIGLYGCLR